MAVGMDRRAKKTASRLDRPLPLQPISNVMSFNPPNHSPGVDGLAPEPASVQSPTDHLEFKNTLTGPDSTIHAPHQASKKRRSSKSKVPGELRRSTSTPHMRNLALQSGELSPTSNKARNKLGYHRTSVACGHCRRRKIRCLLAPDDPQGRCSNCIRLKKECNFFPVEHNIDTQRPSGAVKELSTGTPTTPVASSPRHHGSHTGEKMGEFRPPYHGGPTTAPIAPYGYPGDQDMDPHHTPTSSGAVQHSTYPKPECKRRILEAISLYSKLCIRKRIGDFWSPYSSDHEHKFDNVIWPSE
ncbi:hypothetical protein N0V87_009698 [Didymella glomerata]|uniref:Zn(2)-C6 fungal-type domain-containing protein n=1 Tax=Didymella glomerata TaxID=749621 RepID=A0A9W9BW16_9PLEO|nr:hypothetical protein N0V87_009698 [Didymella glomerata]